MTTEMKTTLTDEQIIDIAETIDKAIVDIGGKHHPAAIELASIALGRLMVFCKQLECYPTFHELLETVIKMGAVDFNREGDNDAENENGGTEQQGSVS